MGSTNSNTVLYEEPQKHSLIFLFSRNPTLKKLCKDIIINYLLWTPRKGERTHFHISRGILTFSLVFPMEKNNSSFRLCKTREIQLCRQYFSIKIRFYVYLGSITKLNRKAEVSVRAFSTVLPLHSGEYLLEEFSWLLWVSSDKL